MSKDKHTPLPWHWDGDIWDYDPEEEAPWLVDEEGHKILYGDIKCDKKADADLIKIAVNSHPALLSVAEKALKYLNAHVKTSVLKKLIENDLTTAINDAKPKDKE